jgi:hypothetical protein
MTKDGIARLSLGHEIFVGFENIVLGWADILSIIQQQGDF